MNHVIKRIEIDLYSPTSYEVIKAQQGDHKTRIVEFILLDQGEPYHISDNIKINLEGCRGDHSGFIKENYCQITDNVISVALDSDILYAPGTVEAKIVMYDNGSILSTIPFKIAVQANPRDKENVEKNKKSVLDDLVNKLNDLSDSIDENKNNNIKQGQAINFLANNTYKNLLKNTAETQTKNGITFTVNPDKSVTVNGTATADTSFFINSFTLPHNYTVPHKYTGTPPAGSDTTYYTEFTYRRRSGSSSATSSSKDYGDGHIIMDHPFYDFVDIEIRITNGYTANNLTFYPMIYLPGYLTDSTYVPYNTSPNKIGDTDKLQTTDKSTIVGAINEVVEDENVIKDTYLPNTGDASNTTASFTPASSRANITAGEKLSSIFGKIAKWFSDLKTVAFSGSYNDLTPESRPTNCNTASSSSGISLSKGWWRVADKNTKYSSGNCWEVTIRIDTDEIRKFLISGMENNTEIIQLSSESGLSNPKITAVRTSYGFVGTSSHLYFDIYLDVETAYHPYKVVVESYDSIAPTAMFSLINDDTGITHNPEIAVGSANVVTETSGVAKEAIRASSVTLTNETSNVYRNVWFSNSDDTSKPVYSTNFQYNPSTDILSVPNILFAPIAGQWLSGKTSAAINTVTPITSASYYPVLRIPTASGHTWSLGAIADKVGMYGYKSDRTANGTDWKTEWNVGTGNITHDKSITAIGGFIGNLEGTATKATQDSDGNIIQETYAKKIIVDEHVLFNGNVMNDSQSGTYSGDLNLADYKAVILSITNAGNPRGSTFAMTSTINGAYPNIECAWVGNNIASSGSGIQATASFSFIGKSYSITKLASGTISVRLILYGIK